MSDIQHSELDYTENHVAHAYEYANTAQREGATGFVAGDVGKLALQTDDKSLWMLTTTAPTWAAAILTGTITVDTIDEDTPGAGVTIDGVVCKDSAVTASSGFTGDITGDVIGGVTGDVVGDVTGDLTGDVLAAGDVLDASGYSRLTPAGGIIMWSGAISAIPNGWLICDGTSSTPDLTDRFVIHADADSGGTNDVGDTGGSTTSGSTALSVSQLPVHTHDIVAEAVVTGGSTVRRVDSIKTDGSGSSTFTNDPISASNTGSGSGHTHTVMPKYYALAYIMKA